MVTPKKIVIGPPKGEQGLEDKLRCVSPRLYPYQGLLKIPQRRQRVELRAYDGLNGFAIGTGRTHSNTNIHDARDSEDLYRVLQKEVIPLYYDRDRDGLPIGWIKRMKRTIRTLGWRFNADRMVMDYTLKRYIPATSGTSSNMRNA